MENFGIDLGMFGFEETSNIKQTTEVIIFYQKACMKVHLLLLLALARA